MNNNQDVEASLNNMTVKIKMFTENKIILKTWKEINIFYKLIYMSNSSY